MTKPVKQKRVVIYMGEEDYKRIRAKLIMKGKSVSEWVREMATSLLKD